MKKLTILAAILMIFSSLSFAQTPATTVSGKVLDSETEKAIGSASVSLFKAVDSSLVKINLTDEDGNFEFQRINAGKYYLLASSVGYLEIFSKEINVTGDTPVSVGNLLLKSNMKTLKGVTVAVKKPFVETRIDRTIVNVDALISSAGSTALEVLEKAPGVTVDKDGKVALKGKQGVLIMLDGRPSYVTGQELANLLKSMPSSSIEQIEIMTNPSSKYDASGNSGIINIKTKKNKMKGINGSITATILQSKYTRTNNSLNFNYRTGKINLFGNYSYSYSRRHQEQVIIRKFRDTGSKEIESIFDQSGTNPYSWQAHNLKAGLDFFANKKTTLGVVFSGYVNPSRNTGTTNTHLNNGSNRIDSIVVADNLNKNTANNISTNVNLRHLFDTSGKEFTIDLDYLNYYQSTDQLLVNNYFYPDFSVRKPTSQLVGDLPSKVNIYSAKSDFIFPLKNSAKIETGVKSSYVTTDNDALYQNKTETGYEIDNGKTNHFIYKENINALYFNFNKQIKKWGIQAGLRAENTNLNGHQVGSGSRPDSLFSRSYLNLFPTAYVSYAANDKNTFSVNYGRRIDRPAYQDLNPFYYFLDEYTYNVGNTLLQPQFSDNIEVSHTYNGFLTTTFNYSKTHNMISEVLKQITEERKTFQTRENIASRTTTGLAVSANIPVASFWSSNLFSNVNFNQFQGQIDGSTLNVDGVTFMANMNNQFKLKKGWSAELSGFYRSKGIESQIVINPMWRLDAGVQKQIIKNKGSLKLSIRDIFNSQNFSGTVNFKDIDVYIKNQSDSRVVSLTFSYRFGKPVKQQQRKTGGASDEQSRVKGPGN